MKRHHSYTEVISRIARGHLRKLHTRGEKKPFPDKAVGQFVYEGDLLEGFDKCVIVAMDEHKHCIVTGTRFCDSQPYAEIASEHHHYSTLEEAIQAAALSDIEYHKPRLDFAEQALNAVKTGADLAPYVRTRTLFAPRAT